MKTLKTILLLPLVSILFAQSQDPYDLPKPYQKREASISFEYDLSLGGKEMAKLSGHYIKTHGESTLHRLTLSVDGKEVVRPIWIMPADLEQKAKSHAIYANVEEMLFFDSDLKKETEFTIRNGLKILFKSPIQVDDSHEIKSLRIELISPKVKPIMPQINTAFEIVNIKENSWFVRLDRILLRDSPIEYFDETPQPAQPNVLRRKSNLSTQKKIPPKIGPWE